MLLHLSVDRAAATVATAMIEAMVELPSICGAASPGTAAAKWPNGGGSTPNWPPGSEADLEDIQDPLNLRPRPALDVDTPAHRLAALLDHAA